MPAQSNIARPYAQALFELAMDQNDLEGWADRLQLLATVASDPRIVELTKSPHVSSAKLVDLISGVCGDNLNGSGHNLIKLLVKNGRVTAMRDIADAFVVRKAEAENVIGAEVITATVIDESKQGQFAEALQRKLGRSVKLNFATDEELIGGAVIRAGDWVVDGSVRAQLEQLAGAINT